MIKLEKLQETTRKCISNRDKQKPKAIKRAIKSHIKNIESDMRYAAKIGKTEVESADIDDISFANMEVDLYMKNEIKKGISEYFVEKGFDVQIGGVFNNRIIVSWE